MNQQSLKALLATLPEQGTAYQAPQDPQNAFLPNPQLEQQVAPQNYPISPLILAWAQKFGITNLLRNTQNQKQMALQDIP